METPAGGQVQIRRAVDKALGTRCVGFIEGALAHGRDGGDTEWKTSAGMKSAIPA